MTLKAVPGGWINTNIQVPTMITQQRKSKYKHIVRFSPARIDDEHSDVRDWCTKHFGPGGRSKKYRWRYGWTDNENVYYFKSSKDAMMFTLRWSDA